MQELWDFRYSETFEEQAVANAFLLAIHFGAKKSDRLTAVIVLISTER